MKPFVLLLAIGWAGVALAAPRTDRNAAWNVNFNADGGDPSRYFGEWPGHRYAASPDDWRDVPVYQLITDRFRDGDPTNNEGRFGGYDLYDVGRRHGGDFRGVKESLGYIKSLGFDAIWISPIFQNRTNSYHGYGQVDFTLLDDRFGTLADFREMVDEAHRLGMYVIVDIIVNHMDDLYGFEGRGPRGSPFRMHGGEYRRVAHDPKESYEDFKVVNEFDPDGTYPDVYGYDGRKQVDDLGAGSYWKSDFHHNGDLEDYADAWQNQLGELYGGLDDLRTSHPRVQDKIIAMTKALISSTDIDGIRMDTPMQVPLSFFKRWAPAVKDHARRLGKGNFFIFGEFYCPRERAATMVGRGRTVDQWGRDAFIDATPTMDSGINYPLYWSFFDAVVKRREGRVADAYEQYRLDRAAFDMGRYVMLNFFDNHDQWRLGWEEDGLRKSRLASGIIAYWPGIPLFYYGDEQGFASRGTALDGWSREDFMTSKAWFNVPHHAGGDFNPAVFDNFNMTHPQYLRVQKLMNVRRQYRALRTSDEARPLWVQMGGASGIVVFDRFGADKKDGAIVAFNTAKDSLEAGGIRTGWDAGDRIVNALDPRERYVLEEDSKLRSLGLDGYEVKVFVREEDLKPLDPVVESVEPAHDAIVPEGKRTVRLRFSESIRPEAFVSYDGKEIVLDALRFADDDHSVAFDVEVTPGIHTIVVSDRARAWDGKRLTGAFRSRFRAGGGSNPIAKLQRDFLEDRSLVAGGPVVDGKRRLSFRHKAAGARSFRVSVDAGRHWTPWQPYVPEAALTVDDPGQAMEAWVQYWADGSAAYFSRGPLNPP